MRDAPWVHVLGSMMIDRVVRVRAIPRPGETVAARSSAVYAGGKGANQAAAAARCGARVRMLGRTGADGAFIVEALRAAGVDVRAVRTDDETSGAATVMVSDAGENAIVIASESNTRLAREDVDAFLASAGAGEFVLLQNECAQLEHAIRASRARGLRVWLNAAPADAELARLPLELLDGLVVNETESEALTGCAEPARALEALAARLPDATVIVTLGAAGAIAALGSRRFAHAGFVVDAVDTVGCGDAFVGAYLAGIAGGCGVDEALRRGNAAGALAAMRAGAMPSLPAREEVEVAAAMPEGARLKPRPGAGDGMPARCEHCDYELAGSRLHEPCPECGRVILPGLFGRNWSQATERRRFLLASVVYRVTALLWAVLLAWVIVEHYSVGVLISRWALAACAVLLPAAMLAVALKAMHSRERMLAVVASVLRVVAPASILAIGPLQGWQYDWALRGILLSIVVCDGLFAAMVPSFARGTRVQGMSVRRTWGLRALAAVAVVVCALEDAVPGPPIGIFVLSAALVVWSAVEVSGVARRMRALELA